MNIGFIYYFFFSCYRAKKKKKNGKLGFISILIRCEFITEYDTAEIRPPRTDDVHVPNCLPDAPLRLEFTDANVLRKKIVNSTRSVSRFRSAIFNRKEDDCVDMRTTDKIYARRLEKKINILNAIMRVHMEFELLV